MSEVHAKKTEFVLSWEIDFKEDDSEKKYLFFFFKDLLCIRILKRKSGNLKKVLFDVIVDCKLITNFTSAQIAILIRTIPGLCWEFSQVAAEQ